MAPMCKSCDASSSGMPKKVIYCFILLSVIDVNLLTLPNLSIKLYHSMYVCIYVEEKNIVQYI